MQAGTFLWSLLVALPAFALASPDARTHLASRRRQSGAPAWAPVASAAIKPGVNTATFGESCTSNFIFYQGAEIYIGQAAHCATMNANGGTNGCTTPSWPEGSPVTVVGATQPGVMVYSSWVRMKARNETDAETCAFNDLALIRLHPKDRANVNPSIPTFGGPTGVRATPLIAREAIYSYQNSIVRQGVTVLKPKYGYSLSELGAKGWEHVIQSLTPGIPGDSGSAFIDARGQAVGILSTVVLAPNALSNGAGDVARQLAYLRSFSDFAGIQLALGTEPFKTNLPSLI